MTQFLHSLICLLIVGMQFASTPAAAAAGAIIVGRSLTLTGPLKGYGEAKRDGGDAYISKVNASGGVGGRPIELVTLDDAYLPANTVANLKKIAAEQQPVAFLGLFGVPTSAAAMPLLLELKIPLVGLSSGSAAVRTPFNRYVFPVRASYADEARKLVNHVSVSGITKVGLVYVDNPFGESLRDALTAALKDAGLTAKVVKVDPAGAGVAAAAQVAADQPQAVFIAVLASVGVPLYTELKKASYRGAVYSFSTLDATAVTKALGAQAMGLGISQVFPIPRGVRVKVVAEYVQAVKDLGRGAPSFYGLEGFIEAKVLVEGLRRAGGRPTPASLVTALETLRELDVGGFFISYRPDAHNGSNFVEIDVINSAGEVAR
jgi:branched-chain amino acid transport system substrate-binding protein